MYLVPIFSPERWQSIGSSAPLSPPQERTVSRRRRETTKCASALNARMIFGTAATTATQKFRRTDSKSFCRFCAAAVPRDRQTDGREVHEVRTYTISTSFRLCAVCDAVKTADSRQKKSPLTQGGRQRVSHDDSCLRCCYAGPIFRTDIVKTTPMTGQDV